MQTNLDAKLNTNMVKFKTDLFICRLLKLRFMAIVDLKLILFSGHRVRNLALMSKGYTCTQAHALVQMPYRAWSYKAQIVCGELCMLKPDCACLV